MDTILLVKYKRNSDNINLTICELYDEGVVNDEQYGRLMDLLTKMQDIVERGR